MRKLCNTESKKTCQFVGRFQILKQNEDTGRWSVKMFRTFNNFFIPFTVFFQTSIIPRDTYRGSLKQHGKLRQPFRLQHSCRIYMGDVIGNVYTWDLSHGESSSLFLLYCSAALWRRIKRTPLSCERPN